MTELLPVFGSIWAPANTSGVYKLSSQTLAPSILCSIAAAEWTGETIIADIYGCAIDFYTTFFHDTGRPECTTFEEQLQMADGECDIFTITVEEIHTHEMVWESWKCSLDNLKHGNKTLNSVFQIGQ